MKQEGIGTGRALSRNREGSPCSSLLRNSQGNPMARVQTLLPLTIEGNHGNDRQNKKFLASEERTVLLLTRPLGAALYRALFA